MLMTNTRHTCSFLRLALSRPQGPPTVGPEGGMSPKGGAFFSEEALADPPPVCGNARRRRYEEISGDGRVVLQPSRVEERSSSH